MQTKMDKPKPRIIIIGGQGQVGKAIHDAALDHDIDVIFDNRECRVNYDIKVNGVKYIQRPETRRSTKRYSKTVQHMMVMSQMMMDHSAPLVKSPLDNLNIDIVKEYGLIQQKSSNLSANQRYAVKAKFEHLFQKI